MAGRHHQLGEHGFGWTPGVGDGQGGMACCGSWGSQRVRHDWETELKQKVEWTLMSITWLIDNQIFFSFIFISWRLITLQYCSVFCHTLTCKCMPNYDISLINKMNTLLTGAKTWANITLCYIKGVKCKSIYLVWSIYSKFKEMKIYRDRNQSSTS